MRRWPWGLVFLLLGAAVQAQVTAIRAGRLADPEKGAAATNQIILVEGGRIREVGANLSIPAGATLVDLSGATVLPGLMDAHTHLCMTLIPERDHGSYYITTLLDPTPYRAIQGVVHARAMLEAGFTTVRDVGNAGNYADTALRQAIERGWVPGPTIINAGRIIAPYGGQFQLQPEKRKLGEPEYFYADSRDELRKAIRENVHYGARVIKLVVDDQPYIYSVEDLRFAVAEAADAGVKVAAHCWSDRGARRAAEAGVASIEHGYQMSDETLRLAKKNGVVLVGTDFTEEAARGIGVADPKRFHAEFVERLRRAYQIGVPIAFGTDVIHAEPGQTRGTLALHYIESFLEAGVPPRDILRMMTSNPACLLGVGGERGAVRPGLAADIIAVRGDPLEDIRALERIVFVMKDGKVFKYIP